MSIFFQLIESIIRNISGQLGRKLRSIYYSKRLGFCGKNLVIDIGVILENPNNIFIGDNVWIDNYSILIAGKIKKNNNVDIRINQSFNFIEGEIHFNGNNHIAPFSLIQGHGGIQVGQNVTIASGAKIYSLSHHYRNTLDENDNKSYYFSTMADINSQFFIQAPVVIGDGAAIGLNTVILPGTTIPDGTWVGVSTYMSGSDNQVNAVYGTQPAVFLKPKK